MATKCTMASLSLYFVAAFENLVPVEKAKTLFHLTLRPISAEAIDKAESTVAKKLPFIFEEIRQAFRDKTSSQSWGDTATQAYSSTVGSLKELGGDTLVKTAAGFNEALPFIKRAGYDVTEVEVGLGLSPKIVPHLQVREIITAEQQAELLAEVQGRKLVSTILTSLFKASAAREKLNFKRFHFSEIELELSILPSVVLKFKPDEFSQAIETETLPTAALIVEEGDTGTSSEDTAGEKT